MPNHIGGSPEAKRAIVSALFSTAPADEWRDEAACSSSDPAIFDEGADGGPTRAYRREIAFSICDRCTVVRKCLDDAIARHEGGVIRGNRVFPDKWSTPPRKRLR